MITVGNIPLGKMHNWEKSYWDKSIGKCPIGKSHIGKGPDPCLDVFAAYDDELMSVLRVTMN